MVCVPRVSLKLYEESGNHEIEKHREDRRVQLWLVANACASKPCNNVENAATRRRVPLTSAHGLSDHRTSDGGTRRHRVSAAVQSALQISAVSVRGRYTQQDDRDIKSFADVHEVSADLEATHPARPAACQTALGRAQVSHLLP